MWCNWSKEIFDLRLTISSATSTWWHKVSFSTYFISCFTSVKEHNLLYCLPTADGEYFDSSLSEVRKHYLIKNSLVPSFNSDR